MSRKNKWPSAWLNNTTYAYWRDYLTNLTVNRFEWVNMPPSVDTRFLELQEIEHGWCLFFLDEITREFYTLPCTLEGPMNIYNVAVNRMAYSPASMYQYRCTEADSVIIWNDLLRQPLRNVIDLYAGKFYEIERAIDTNVKLQKFPGLVKTNEKQRLVIENLMMKYDGNVPFIFADDKLDINGLEVIDFKAPYIADKLFQLKQNTMNEFLTLIGVENSNNQKKERMVSDEIGSNYGNIEAARNIGLTPRKTACDQINAMFGLDIDVQYSSVLPTMVNAAMNPFLMPDEFDEDDDDEEEGEED